MRNRDSNAPCGIVTRMHLAARFLASAGEAHTARARIMMGPRRDPLAGHAPGDWRSGRSARPTISTHKVLGSSLAVSRAPPSAIGGLRAPWPLLSSYCAREISPVQNLLCPSVSGLAPPAPARPAAPALAPTHRASCLCLDPHAEKRVAQLIYLPIRLFWTKVPPQHL